MSGELWRECASWLNKLKLLPNTSACLSKGARVYDLALALQDGVVLCYLAERIAPKSVGTIHGKIDGGRPEKQFLKMQNINAFLDLCPKFGVKSGDLFDADELYYASDFPKVVTCLEKLSKGKAAAKAKLPPFGQGGSKNVAADDQGEDMYQSLEDLVGQSISFNEASANSAAYDPDDDAEEDPVYGSIMNVIQAGGGGAAAAEDVYSAMLYTKKPITEEEESIYSGGGPQDKRSMVLGEVAETERNYVEVLKVIIDKFMRPMEASGKINRGDCKTIFSNVTDILAVHVEFLKDLDRALSSTTGRNISQPFMTNLPKMRVYGQFCCDVPKAMDSFSSPEELWGHKDD